MIDYKTLRNIFHKELDPIYEKQEINNFIFILLEKYTGMNKMQILSSDKIIIENIADFKTAIEDLKLYKPIQYITGYTWFKDLKIFVNQEVLIPRPETEQLIDIIEKQFINSKKKIKILDIGTGSGCIAIALKKYLPFSELYSIDISEKAIEIAKQNADFNNVKINFFIYDILNTEENLNLKDIDIIVSNPPYVRESEMMNIKKNVIDYEPHKALFVKDKEPLIFYKAILDWHYKYNGKQNTEIYFEINEYLYNDFDSLLQAYSVKNKQFINDFFNKTRFLHLTTK